MRIKNIELFVKRNLKKYVNNSLFGVYSLLKEPNYGLKFYLKSLQVLFSFYFFNRIYIPQVEFVITTNCTLKCEQCSNYIPSISKKKNYKITITDFKKHITNLTKNIEKLNSLIIVGGEPLLHPEIYDILKYSLTLKKVEKLYVYTNCTILFSDEILKLLSLNRKKVHIYLSNYSRNPELEKILKIKEIKEQLNSHKISYTFNEKLVWTRQEEIECKKRTNIDNIKTCKSCGVPSVSAIDGELHYCPKASAAKLLDIVKYTETDFIDLNNEVKKQDIINFYSNDNFSICGYCSGPQEMQYVIKPAKQIKD